jgi:hypothetical protein
LLVTACPGGGGGGSALDCNALTDVKGLVSVDEPVGDEWIVVLVKRPRNQTRAI